MSKVGIMTWFTYNNYGTVFQAYSLSQKIKDFGYETYLINYKPKTRKKRIDEMTPKLLIDALKLKQYQKNTRNNIKVTGEKFDVFRTNNLQVTNECYGYTDLNKLGNEFEKVICGSDQVWSPNVFDSHYYLDFVDDNKKKIAYAPSFGVSYIKNNDIRNQIGQLLDGFENISVRENQGKEIIKSITGKDAKEVLDPTLLLDKKEWIESLKINENKGKYIFCYFLGNNSKYVSIARDVSKKLGLEIKVVPINNLYRNFSQSEILENCGPIEFLEYLNNSSYIITDSFHGILFALNFNIPFVALKRFKDNNTSQNSRVYNILKRVDLEDRLYNKGMDYSKKIDFEKINKIIKKEREYSIKYLKDSLCKSNDNRDFKITKSCTGCGACVAACKQGAVRLRKNKYGFLEYEIDEQKCINCGLCKKICGQCNNELKNINEQKVYSAYSKNMEILKTSSSGGIAYELSYKAIEDGLPVIGCAYNYEEKRAEHILVDKKEDLFKLSGSKYIQSYTIETFKKIKDMDSALIIGTPCQIAALNNYLKLLNKRNNFILIDLICHGVPSDYVWTRFTKKYQIDNLKFRDKKYGWKTALTVNSKKIPKKEFYNFFESGLIYDRCCYDCNYREFTAADIRLGDYWGKKSKLGISKVIVNTEKGESFLNSIKDRIIINSEDIKLCFKNQQRKNAPLPLEYYSILEMFANDNIDTDVIRKRYCKRVIIDREIRSKGYGLIKKLCRK